MGKRTPATQPRGPLERERAPEGPRAPGEYPGKRDQDERNDPAVQPGAVEGNPARRGRARRIGPDVGGTGPGAG